jgi:hypothetical protein
MKTWPQSASRHRKKSRRKGLLVLVQFAIGPEIRPPVAKEALVTEPTKFA